MVLSSVRRFVAMGLVASHFFLLTTPVAQAQSSSFTGAQIYQGLVQFRGPVAGLIPEIAEIQQLIPEIVPQEHLAEYLQFQDSMLASIDQRWPGWLDDFKQEIESGDHLRVQVALHQGYSKALAVLADDPEFRPYFDELRASVEAKEQLAVVSGSLGKEILLADVDRLLDETKFEGGSSPIGFCAALNIVLIVNAAVYFNVAVAQNIWRWLLVRTTVAVQVRNTRETPSLLPELLPSEDSIAFQSRMNSGRLAAERMIDRIVKVLG